MSTLVLPLIEKRFSSMHAVLVTYTVRVDCNRTVEMTGDQADLDKILVAMQTIAAEPADRSTGIDYVLGTEEHGAVGSLDLLNLMHPETAGLAMCQAIHKTWPDASQDRVDLLELARQYLASRENSDRRIFLSAFSNWRSKFSPAIWSALTSSMMLK